MTASAEPGPRSTTGQSPPILGPSSNTGGQPAYLDSNPDMAPNLEWMGHGVRDPRYLPHVGAGANIAGGYPNQDCGWYVSGPGILCCDQVPSTVETNNIAVAANVVSGTAMTLVAAAGAGITILASPLTILPTGNVVPAGALVIDGSPSWTGGGSSGAFAFFNPGAGYGRAVSVTGSAGSAGGAFLFRGYDLYGYPQTELVTVGAGAVTQNGKKGWKFITSVTPQFTDAHNYSIGDADIYEFAILANRFEHTAIYWNGTQIIANTGFVGADATPATNITGSVRGTYATQSASDGTKRLMISVGPSFAVIASTYAAAVAALVGVTPA